MFRFFTSGPWFRLAVIVLVLGVLAGCQWLVSMGNVGCWQEECKAKGAEAGMYALGLFVLTGVLVVFGIVGRWMSRRSANPTQ